MLDSVKLSQVNNKLNAINNKFRFKLVKELIKDNDLSVTELSHKIKRDQSSTSQYLIELEKAGFIRKEKSRDNRFTYHKVDTKKVSQVINIIENEENILFKSYLLSNKYCSKILDVLNGQDLTLVGIDKLAKISSSANTGMAYGLLKN